MEDEGDLKKENENEFKNRLVHSKFNTELVSTNGQKKNTFLRQKNIGFQSFAKVIKMKAVTQFLLLLLLIKMKTHLANIRLRLGTRNKSLEAGN